MAHLEVNTFLNQFISSVEPFYKQSRVLEIGSYDVNGSVRSNFKYVHEYIGVDLIPGPSVDIVSKGHLYRDKSKFHIVLSVESFEHNSDWFKTFINMVNLADQDAIVIFTCATKGRLEHGTYRTDPFSSPGTASIDNSYYRNLGIDDFEKIPDFDKYFISHGFYVNHLTKDIYFYGLKSNKRIDVNVAASFFRNATEISSKIRRKTNFKSYLMITILYFLLAPLYSFLSDRNYQKVTYPAYKRIRNLFRSLNG
jgi:hypothetical protein